MYNRKDYLDKKCSHGEYYAQFVTPAEMEEVKNVPLDAKLTIWDFMRLSAESVKLFKEAGECYTLSVKVCILKQAKKIQIEGSK